MLFENYYKYLCNLQGINSIAALRNEDFFPTTRHICTIAIEITLNCHTSKGTLTVIAIATRVYTEKTIFSFPFKLNGIRSC